MLIDYFKGKNSGEITNRLIILDKSIMDLHNNGFYVVGDMSNIEVINDDSEDKESSRVFMCIDALVKQIGEKLAEMQNIEEVLDEESEDGISKE